MQEASTMLSLKWDSFSSQMTSSLDVCYEKQYFVDLSLVCKNGTIVKCHKMVLANASSFFRRLLVKNEHSHPMIILHDIDAEDLRFVVNFMYTGEIQVSKSKVGRILKIGEILEVSGLKDIRGTILTSENEKTRPKNPVIPTNTENSIKIIETKSLKKNTKFENHENPGSSVNTENSIRIVETRSLKKNTRVEIPDSAITRRITRSFRKSHERKNESGYEIENNTKLRGNASRKHENNVDQFESMERSIDSINSQSEMVEKIGKSGNKRVYAEKEISWSKVLAQICDENEDLPLKRLCLMNEIEITKSVPMDEPSSPFGRPPDNSMVVSNLPAIENYVNCGVLIKDEFDSPESDRESIELSMNNDEVSEHERLMNNSGSRYFEHWI